MILGFGAPPTRTLNHREIYALMSSFEACGIREPKAETKEVLLQKARRLAKQAAEMSGGADSGVREYYYGASNLNPEISPFTPERRASSTSSTPANGTQPQATPPTPKFTLNPESKAFVPPSSLANRVPTLNVEAAPFIPPSQLVAAQRTDVGATVTAEMGALSMVGMAICVCCNVALFVLCRLLPVCLCVRVSVVSVCVSVWSLCACQCGLCVCVSVVTVCVCGGVCACACACVKGDHTSSLS